MDGSSITIAKMLKTFLEVDVFVLSNNINLFLKKNCSYLKCNIIFKFINKLKLNKLYFKFNNNFKSHIIFKKTLK